MAIPSRDGHTTLSVAAVLRDAWAIFRRDREVLLAVAAPFFFLPVFALSLLLPPPPRSQASGGDSAAALAYLQTLGEWLRANGGWYLGGYAVACIGAASLYALYLDPERGDVAAALRRSVAILPRYLLAMLVIALPVGAGIRLLVIPGLYVLGRVMLTGPALLSERPLGAVAAIQRSLWLSRGSSLPLMALASIGVVGGWVSSQPFELLDAAMRRSAVNRVALAIVDAGAAGVGMIAALAGVLIAIAAYRRLST